MKKKGVTRPASRSSSGEICNKESDDTQMDDEDNEKQELRKQLKTKRELKKLEFDNKKFNLDASNADYTCTDCGETFLYEVQLKSHGVFTDPSSDNDIHSETSAVLRYRCNICSRLWFDLQAYIDHFDIKECKDGEKRRLKAFDSCICLLCGYATTRSKLSRHLCEEHTDDAPTLTPTNKGDSLYSCPMCVTEGGGSVVVATSNDLLLHLSTWHPTAIILEKRASFENIHSPKTKRQSRETINDDNDSGSDDDRMEPVVSGWRFCLRCRMNVPNRNYAQHRRLCLQKILQKKSRVLKRGPKKRPKFHINDSTISTLSATSIEKLRRFRTCGPLLGKVDDEPSSNTSLLESEITTADEGSSPSSSSKQKAYEKLASVWTQSSKRSWKKPYTCANCNKEFGEPLGYFIHLVSQFCHGNRGLLESTFCPLCNEAVKSAPAMLDHVRRKHCGDDGLRVDKSARIEFNELATEIIGFNYICATCGRGFYAKSRCNTARPHLGTKIPLQNNTILRCKMCSHRVKSRTQLTLHLWAIHNYGTMQIKKTLSEANAPEGTARFHQKKELKADSISDEAIRQTYANAKEWGNNGGKDAPLLLKCSSCTTRFASFLALQTHNKLFHDGPRKDDSDFHLVSKIFFYRQSDSHFLNGSTTIFDGILGNTQITTFPGDLENSFADTTSILTLEPSGIVPVETIRPKRIRVFDGEPSAKRVKATVWHGASAVQTSNVVKRPVRTEPTSRVALPTVRPMLPMPSLVRIPNPVSMTTPTKSCEVITLDDDEMSHRTGSMANQGVGERRNGTILVRATSQPLPVSTFAAFAAGVNVPTIIPRSTQNAPVVLRAFSLRPSSLPPRLPATLANVSTNMIGRVRSIATSPGTSIAVSGTNWIYRTPGPRAIAPAMKNINQGQQNYVLQVGQHKINSNSISTVRYPSLVQVSTASTGANGAHTAPQTTTPTSTMSRIVIRTVKSADNQKATNATAEYTKDG